MPVFPKRFMAASALCLAVLLAGLIVPGSACAIEQARTRFLTSTEPVDPNWVAERAVGQNAGDRAIRAIYSEGNVVAQAISKALAGRGQNELPIWAARGVCVDLTDKDLSEILAEFPTLRSETLDQTAEPISSSLPVVSSLPRLESTAPNSWNLAMSGSTALLQERQLTGKNVLVGVVGPDLPVNHPCLRGRVVSAKFFGDPHQRGGTLEDLMLLHPLGVLAGFLPGKFQGVATQVSISLATVSKGKVKPKELMAAIQWVIGPFSEMKPTALLICVDFSVPAPGAMREVLRSCRTAGILPILPAGNVPSRITGIAALPEVLTVGGLDQWKVRAGFSGIGPSVVDGIPVMKPDLSEPGVSIYGPSSDGAYRFGSGTLQAAAHFAGIWAQVRQARPEDDIQVILDAMATTTLDLGAFGPDCETGIGLVNPFSAIYTIENPPPPPPAAPLAGRPTESK